VVGQYIVFDGERGYAARAYPNAARWLYYEAGQAYELYAGKTDVPAAGEKLYALQPAEHDWSKRLPLRPKAMVVAGDLLFVAGPPDPAAPEQALAALEGKRGARLWVVQAGEGTTLAKYDLDSPPVYDGMAAAAGRLFVSTKNGRVLCFGPKTETSAY
jgi:outer membrane protein assembly factor BamB